MPIYSFKPKRYSDNMLVKVCIRCGKTFEFKRITKKYCSNTCRTYAALERKYGGKKEEGK